IFKRQLDGEPAPFSHLTAHEHSAAVRFDNMFHDAQADANPLRFTSQFRAAPVKALEDFFVLFWRNAIAMVFDPKSDKGRGSLQSYRHHSTLWRMFDGIVYEVYQRLLD